MTPSTIVLIPIYQPLLSVLEQFSLDHSLPLLAGRDVRFIGPRGLDYGYYQLRYPGIPFEAFDPVYFASIAGYNQLLLSPAFFDAEQHPEIRFRSDAFSSTASGELSVRGSLSVRGRERRARFAVRAEGCTLDERPQDCHVHVRGSLRRSRFGMVEYSRTLADEVHLDIEVRLRPPEAR